MQIMIRLMRRVRGETLAPPIASREVSAGRCTDVRGEVSMDGVVNRNAQRSQ
jgi:hypothetical protein